MTTRTDEVKVLEVFKVVPILGTASTQTSSLPLTFFDALFLRFPPIKRLFFYEAPPPPPSSNGVDTLETILIPKLRHSLSVALKDYLPLAGKLSWPPESDRPIIQYHQGDAVSLTIARTEADFERLSGYGFREATEFQSYLPELEGTDTEVPVIALQMTLFGNRGFSVGYSAHHAATDDKSICMFIHSWASLCRTEEEDGSTWKPELTPCYSTSLLQARADLMTVCLQFWLERSGPNNKSLKMWEDNAPSSVMLGTFLLTRKNIDHLKDNVLSQWQEKKQHISTFTVTVGYIWSCLVKTKELTTEKVHLGFPFDCRARLDPQLPSTYFGNCVFASVVTMDLSKLLEENGVANAAAAIGGVIKSLNKDGVHLESWLRKTISPPPLGSFETISGTPLVGLYNTNFGWGKPKKVDLVSIAKGGSISLADSSDGNGGIEIGIALAHPQLQRFASFFEAGLL